MAREFVNSKSSRRIDSDTERQAPTSIEEAEPSHRARYTFALEFVPAGARVLDVPCGTGYGTALLGSRAREAFGVDISPEAIGHAEEFFGGDTVHFGVENAQKLSDALQFVGPFDVVVSFEGIEHVSHPEVFLREIRKMLSPGGRLIISTPRKPHGSPHHIVEFSLKEFEQILKRAGFQIEDMYGQIYTDIFKLSEHPEVDPHSFHRFNYIAVCHMEQKSTASE